MKHEEIYEEMGETWGKLPVDGFLSHLVTSFQAAWYIVGFTRERYALWANQYIAVHLFHGFLPCMISEAKFILIGFGGDD